MTIHRVVTNQARPLRFGGLSKFAVTPVGGVRAGEASRAASSTDDNDMVDRCVHNEWISIRIEVEYDLIYAVDFRRGAVDALLLR